MVILEPNINEIAAAFGAADAVKLERVRFSADFDAASAFFHVFALPPVFVVDMIRMRRLHRWNLWMRFQRFEAPGAELRSVTSKRVFINNPIGGVYQLVQKCVSDSRRRVQNMRRKLDRTFLLRSGDVDSGTAATRRRAQMLVPDNCHQTVFARKNILALMLYVYLNRNWSQDIHFIAR